MVHGPYVHAYRHRERTTKQPIFAFTHIYGAYKQLNLHRNICPHTYYGDISMHWHCLYLDTNFIITDNLNLIIDLSPLTIDP